MQEAHAVCEGVLGERTWSSGRRRCANCCGVLCTEFTSGGYLVSAELYPKSLVSLEDGLECLGGQEERPPSLQVHPRSPPM